MKIKVAKKIMRTQNCIAIGYGYAQYLLHYHHAHAYSASVYGWDCDYYNINNVIISSGYRPVGMKIDHKIIAAYDDHARLIILSDQSYDQKLLQVNEVLNDFLEIAKNK